MDLTHTEERSELAESVRAFVARDWPTATVRELQASETGFDPARWKRIAGLGWTAMPVPEEHGGLGGGFLDLAVVAEELGRGAVSSPLAATVTHGVLPLLWAGESSVRESRLVGLVGGETIACPADVEADGRSIWPAEPAPADGHGWTLDGTKVLVPFAEVADLLMVTARLEGRGEAIVALPRTLDGVTTSRMRLPVGDPVYRVDLSGVRITPDDLLATGPSATDLKARTDGVSALVSCAYTVGLCESALRLAVEHARSREQFGRPIGAFQSVANRCADMRVETDAFRWLTCEAAWLLDRADGPDRAHSADRIGRDAGLAIATAKAYGDLAVRTVVRDSHQVLAGMGISTEHDLYLFTRRARTFEQSGGSLVSHLNRVADLIGL